MVDIAIARCNNDRLQKFQGIPTNQKFFGISFNWIDSTDLFANSRFVKLSHTHLRLRFAVRIQGSEQGKPSYPFFKENRATANHRRKRPGTLWTIGSLVIISSGFVRQFLYSRRGYLWNHAGQFARSFTTSNRLRTKNAVKGRSATDGMHRSNGRLFVLAAHPVRKSQFLPQFVQHPHVLSLHRQNSGHWYV